MNDATQQVIYTPPEGEDVLRSKLANWERYIHEAEEIDPLIRLAVMHYQFEAIHPFVDGNGRTGRVLNLLYLVDRGLLDIPVLYLSRHIIRNRAALLPISAGGDDAAGLGSMDTLHSGGCQNDGGMDDGENPRDPGASQRDGRCHSAEDAEDLLPGAGGADLRQSPTAGSADVGQSGYRQAPDGRRLPESPYGRRSSLRRSGRGARTSTSIRGSWRFWPSASDYARRGQRYSILS